MTLCALCSLKKFAGDCFHTAVEAALKPFKALSYRCGTVPSAPNVNTKARAASPYVHMH